MTHTPGPWHAVYMGSEGWSVHPEMDVSRQERILHVANCFSGTMAQSGDNAHLIAATPDLLEACEKMIAIGSARWYKDGRRQTIEALELMGRAVNRAKGESND